MTETTALPRNIVRLSRRPDGIELYFPPLRAPAGALGLGLFGALCLALPLFALSGLLSTSESNAHDLLAITLLGAFVAPFPVFGVVFIGLAVYMLANSLTVSVNPSAIRTVRRVFGLVLNRRELKCADIVSLEAQIAAKYQSLFSTEPYFRLVARRTRRGEARGRGSAQATGTMPLLAHDFREEVARHATLRKNDLVVAESLQGEALMAQMQALIARHAGLAAVGMTE